MIVAALIGVGLIAIPGSPFHKGATLGLDLQGGSYVLFEAQVADGVKDRLQGLVDEVRAALRKAWQTSCCSE